MILNTNNIFQWIYFINWWRRR